MGEQLFYNTIEKPSLAEFKDREATFLPTPFLLKPLMILRSIYNI